MSEKFTKVAVKVMEAAKELVDWGIGEGHTTHARLRLTIAARQEMVGRLMDAGMSQRDAAKALGVDKRTVGRDLGRGGAKRPSKAERRAERERELGEFQVALPDKRYGVIVADPAWRFEPYSRETGMDRAADNHYATTATDVIKALPVPRIAADDCVLFLWATAPMLYDALCVMAAWEFKYQTCAVWDKIHMGTGYWFRNRAELLLLGTRGNPPCPAMGEQFANLFAVARTKHSEKPEQILEVIESYFPNLPKIELNRRGPARPGWDGWGAGYVEDDSGGAGLRSVEGGRSAASG
jgi:N6-adenosine-specific RNA methylase IME4